MWKFGVLAALMAAGGCAAPQISTAQTSGPSPATIEAATAKIVDIERRSGGRLGVTLVDPQGRVLFSHRGNERFAMCSTFKTLLAAKILTGADGLQLDDRLTIDPAAVEGHAPFTRSRLDARWMTVGEAAEHIVTVSDNAAANLLLDRVGGPQGLTQWVRTLGDDVTRLDRREPMLNENAAGDLRDTTEPLAFAQTYSKVMNDEAVLGPAQRDRLAGWLAASVTGLNRLRAGMPEDWRVGDKTGFCAEPGAVEINDVAVFNPEGKGWYTLVFLLDRPRETGAAVDALGAEVGAIAAEVVRGAS